MGAQFIAKEGTLEGLILTLNEGEEWTLGRDPESCQLVIEDPKVSRQHVICRQTEQGIVIDNLSRTNPVLINNVPVTDPVLLQEGDVVKIGSTFFRFTLQQPSSPVSALPSSFSPLKEELVEQLESPYETVFKDIEKTLTPPMDLKVSDRWLLKMIAGPQSGAEFAMETGKNYIIGNDPSLCDIVVYDLSVSKQHAKIVISQDGQCSIEDLQSRNGTIVDGKKTEEKTTLLGQQIISLGTTSFVMIDREQASETIFALPPQKQPQEELKTVSEPQEKEPSSEAMAAAAVVSLERSSMTTGGLLVAFIIVGFCAIIGIGTWQLFNGKEAFIEQKDYSGVIVKALSPFPDVSFTYNKATGTLFLVGHVLTLVDQNQLLYNLQGLTFISHIDDVNVIVDQLVWQEMNTLIAKNSLWNGINMYASKPGLFVLTGYLRTSQEAGQLTDYINRNFPYLDRLENKVVVEQDLIAKVQGDLFGAGMSSVNAQVINGEVTLTGFVGTNQMTTYQNLIKHWKTTPGVRVIKNYVSAVTQQEAQVDLSSRYAVTGNTKSDEVNINVIINGRILTRGDTIDGMTITSIQPDTIFLEKDGLKFKINYNSQ